MRAGDAGPLNAACALIRLVSSHRPPPDAPDPLAGDDRCHCIHALRLRPHASCERHHGALFTPKTLRQKGAVGLERAVRACAPACVCVHVHETDRGSAQSHRWALEYSACPSFSPVKLNKPSASSLKSVGYNFFFSLSTSSCFWWAAGVSDVTQPSHAEVLVAFKAVKPGTGSWNFINFLFFFFFLFKKNFIYKMQTKTGSITSTAESNRK